MGYGNADLGFNDAVKVFGSDFDVREPRVICATLKVNACIEFAAADEAEIARRREAYFRPYHDALAAEIDPGCPPPLTEAAAKGYANSQVVIVTNATHGVINASPCTRRMARDFLRDPSAPVDRSCLPAADTPL